MKKLILILGLVLVTCLYAETPEEQFAERDDVFRTYPVVEVVSMYDADTIDVVLDLGLGVLKKERLRFYGINAWEITGEEKPKGKIAKQFVVDAVKEGKEIYLMVPEKERGKFGRLLSIVMIDGKNINIELVKAGHARINFYD